MSNRLTASACLINFITEGILYGTLFSVLGNSENISIENSYAIFVLAVTLLLGQMAYSRKKYAKGELSIAVIILDAPLCYQVVFGATLAVTLMFKFSSHLLFGLPFPLSAALFMVAARITLIVFLKKIIFKEAIKI